MVPSPRPLDGLVVVTIEQAIAVPFATRQLADLGARVIKIERPDGGDFARGYDEAVNGLSSWFVWCNRNKESVALDLKADEGADVARRLVARADVFVQNLAPGAAERLGLGATQLAAEYPRLVACDLSGYGDSGPYRDKKAYDLLIQCEAGLVSITGTPDEPAKVGISVADISGGMYVFSGVLAALYERERTGRGAAFEVSLFDSLSEWMSYAWYTAAYQGAPPPRTGARHASIAPYGPFATAGGEQVNLGVQNEREWRTFCEDVLDRPELTDDERFASNPERIRHRDELQAAIEEAFAGLDVDEVERRLDAARIANARMRSVGELVDHPQAVARGRWREVGSPAGPLRALVPPVTLRDGDARMDPVPALGEHTESVLRWLDEP